MRALSPLVLLVVLTTAAWADDVDAARKHYHQAQKFFDLGQYKDAAREYEAAYLAKSDPAFLFNLGQAYRGLGDAAAALRNYRAYLRNRPDAPNRAEVEAHIVKLQKQVDELPQKTPPPATPATVGVVQVSAAPPPRTPVYKKWWLWTAVGGVVVVGLTVGLAVAYTTPNDASGPPGTIPLRF